MVTELDLSILIPVHDIEPANARITNKVLESAAIAAQTFNAEVIVIDDQSPCKEALEEITESPNITRLHRNQNPQGLVFAINYGANVARGGLLTYCHSDCLIKAHTIGKLLKLFSDPAVGIGISELWFSNGDLQQVGGWIGPGFRLAWDTDLSSMARQTHWGDFWTVRRRLFYEVGGLAECYNPGYWECVDLAASIWLKGFHVMTCPGSKVIHLKSQTFHRMFKEEERTYLFERNRKIFSNRWRAFESEFTKSVPTSIGAEEWK